jgi:hypothetical protein
MGIVQLNRTYQVCATCAFWSGPREILGEDVSFNNRDSGICGGSSFNGWHMGAISTCTFWETCRQPRNRNGKNDSPAVNNLTT